MKKTFYILAVFSMLLAVPAPSYAQSDKAIELFEQATVAYSEKAYGERNPKLVQKVERDQLPPNLKPGMVVQMEVPGLEGIAPPLIFHVADVGESIVKLDGNHPFAGKDLRFMGRIRRVRPATEEEMRTGRIARDA